jgi:hypothetical protein
VIELAEAQFELMPSSDDTDVDGLHMGRFTSVAVQSFEPDGPEIRIADAAVAMGDGIRMGRDFRAGRVISMELAAVSPTGSTQPAVDALNALDKLESAWAADRVRMSPGAVQVLRWRAGGRVRRVYGRPRAISPITNTYHQGSIPVAADFQCIDDLYYADQRSVVTVGIAIAANAWTTWPVDWPIVWRKAESGNAGTILVEGTRATWPSFTIHGPVLNPTIVIGGYGEIKFTTNLLYDQTLYIDTRPWNRGVRRENGASLAGVMDTRSTPLSQLRFPPGTYSVALKGVDPTGTASLVVEHRAAYSSF